MTLLKNEQVRHDLDRADAVIRACWDNFKAKEPTFVLRDLIVMEIARAREAEREACAKIVEDHQEEFSSGFAGSGFHLSPRLHGNETGLSFARAIRARSL